MASNADSVLSVRLKVHVAAGGQTFPLLAYPQTCLTKIEKENVCICPLWSSVDYNKYSSKFVIIVMVNHCWPCA